MKTERFFLVRFDNEEIKARYVPDCGIELLEDNGDSYETYSSRESEIVRKIEDDIDLAIEESWITETDQNFQEI